MKIVSWPVSRGEDAPNYFPKTLATAVHLGVAINTVRSAVLRHPPGFVFLKNLSTGATALMRNKGSIEVTSARNIACTGAGTDNRLGRYTAYDNGHEVGEIFACNIGHARELAKITYKLEEDVLGCLPRRYASPLMDAKRDGFGARSHQRGKLRCLLNK